MPAMLLCAFCFVELIPSASHAGESNRVAGPGGVIVHSQFGGQIFGFDIDPNGNEGILSESPGLAGWKLPGGSRDLRSNHRRNHPGH